MLEGLPAEVGPHTHRTVPSLGEGSALRIVLVVPEPHADKAPPLQGVLRVEGTAEDHVGGGEEGDWEVEEPVEDSGSTCR